MVKCYDCPEEASPNRKRCEKHLAHYRDYANRNADRNRDKWLVRKYGISLAEYNHMFEEREGLCDLCGNSETARTGRYVQEAPNWLAVDHDHETGKVRGLLCRDCNVALGLLKDDSYLLRKAADYLDGV